MFYGLHVKPLDNGKFEASSPDLPECIFDADSIDCLLYTSDAADEL